MAKDEAQDNITRGLKCYWSRSLGSILRVTDTMLDLRARKDVIRLHNPFSSKGVGKVVTASYRKPPEVPCEDGKFFELQRQSLETPGQIPGQ